MKRRKNNRAAKKFAAAERRSYVGMAMGVVLFALIVTPAFLNIPTISPETMVRAQVVRGEKIDLAVSTPVASAETNSLAVLSNSIAAAAPTNPGQITPKTFTVGDVSVTVRPKMAAADSNSLPETVEQDGKKYLNLTFARLASFPFKVTPEVADANDHPQIASAQVREQVPEAIKALSEKSAAVTGFMLPVSVNDGLTSDFLLLRNQSACCYGIMPRVNEWVIVRTAGKGVKPIMDVPVTALGTFHVGEMRNNGNLTGIYMLDCDQLLPTK